MGVVVTVVGTGRCGTVGFGRRSERLVLLRRHRGEPFDEREDLPQLVVGVRGAEGRHPRHLDPVLQDPVDLLRTPLLRLFAEAGRCRRHTLADNAPIAPRRSVAHLVHLRIRDRLPPGKAHVPRRGCSVVKPRTGEDEGEDQEYERERERVRHLLRRTAFSTLLLLSGRPLMPHTQTNTGRGGFDTEERQEAEERSAPHVAAIHETIRLEGEEELKRSPQALAWSGLAAGLSMGFSLVTQGYLQAALPETDWRTLVVKLGYSVGFLVVILGRQQLFTENTLTPVLPMLHDVRGKIRRVAMLWGVVLVTNLLGAGLFAWALSAAPNFDPGTQQAFLEIGLDVYRGDFLATFTAALFAGWLIALMVWMLPFAESGRVAVIVIVTYVVGLGHLDHSIAGSVEVLYLVAEGEVGFFDYLGHFLAPAVLGNVVGGVVFVALLNHAQVVASEDRG